MKLTKRLQTHSALYLLIRWSIPVFNEHGQRRSMPICGDVNALGDLYTLAWWTNAMPKRPDPPLVLGCVRSMEQTLYSTFSSDSFLSKILFAKLFSSQQIDQVFLLLLFFPLNLFPFLKKKVFLRSQLTSKLYFTLRPLVTFCICIFVDLVRPGEIFFTFILIFVSLAEFFCS